MQSVFKISQFDLCFGNNIIYFSVNIPGKRTVYTQLLLMETSQTLYYSIHVFLIFTPTVSQKEDLLLYFFLKLNFEVWIL